MCVRYYLRIPFISIYPLIFEFLNFVRILLYENFYSTKFSRITIYDSKSSTHVYVHVYQTWYICDPKSSTHVHVYMYMLCNFTNV